MARRPSSVPRRRGPAEPRDAGLRERLLAVTLSMVEHDDVSAVSLREVARRAGVTPGAPYHHFPSRTMLLAAVAEEGFAALAEAMNRAAGAAFTASALERLAAISTAYLRFALEHRAHYRVMFLPEFPTEPGLEALQSAGLGTLMRLIDSVHALKPSASRHEALVAAVACWSMAHGFVALWNDGLLSKTPALPDREAMTTTMGRLVAASALAALGA